VARRLVEAGVGLVTVPWMYLISTQNFDTHSNHFKTDEGLVTTPRRSGVFGLAGRSGRSRPAGRNISGLDRRIRETPKINGNAGRDHWGNVYSTVLAGGGVRGGQVYGSSDKSAAEPVRNPVHARDFVRRSTTRWVTVPARLSTTWGADRTPSSRVNRFSGCFEPALLPVPRSSAAWP